MAAHLLTHASCPGVSSTPASLTSSSSRAGLVLSPSRPAPPSSRASHASLNYSGCTSSSIPSSVSDKVHCVCGAMRNDGNPLVECTKCGASSHLQCAHLTQRTAKRAILVCHRCKNNTSDTSGAASLASRRKGVIFADPVAKGKSKPKNKSVKKTHLFFYIYHHFPFSIHCYNSLPIHPPIPLHSIYLSLPACCFGVTRPYYICGCCLFPTHCFRVARY